MNKYINTQHKQLQNVPKYAVYVPISMYDGSLNLSINDEFNNQWAEIHRIIAYHQRHASAQQASAPRKGAFPKKTGTLR